MLENIKNILRSNKLLFKPLSYFYKIIVISVLYPIRAKKNFNKFKEYNANNSDEFIREAMTMLDQNKQLFIPFKFINKYKNFNAEIAYSTTGFPAIKINNNLIYFPKGTKKKDIIGQVRTHLIEQDEASPHKYIADKSKMRGHTAILIGASDGLFALDIIDSFKHIFLFECDKTWIESLTKTISPFKEKITILNMFVADITTDKQKRLDDIFKDYEHSIDFLQADVEGAACMVLRGAENTLSFHKPSIALACYHSHNEANEITAMLEKFNYKINFSSKFVYMWMQPGLQEPFIRKGVLYAEK